MTRRISAGASLGKSLSRPLRALATDLGGPARFFTLRSRRTPPFSCSPKFIPLFDTSAGEAIVKGQFTYKGQNLDVGPSGEPWTTPVPSEMFADQVHRFSWLPELAVLGEAKAGASARQLVDSWIVTYGAWNPFSWQPDILTDRLFALLSTWRVFFAGTADSDAARRANIYRQIGRLKRKFSQVTPGLPRLKAAATLALAGAMLDDKHLMDRNLDRLDDALEQQVLGDGGHISRRPLAAVEILNILLTLESALESKGVQGSKQTRRAIDRLAPTLGFFTLSDGKLASFNGSGEYNPKLLKIIAKQADVTSKPFSYMPHSGYHKLEQNGTALLIDTGESPSRPFDLRAHIAPLAFELTTPSGRLIVNCGINDEQPEKWQSSVRETAAHSALVLDDCSAGEIIKSSLHGPAINISAGPVKASRKELDSGLWLESNHDGYRNATGLTHRRRIYMDALGADIRGEDSLSVPMGSAPKYSGSTYPFDIRFHIHPDVRVTLARDLKSALLILSNGDGWRFRTDSGPLALERSVYLARGTRPERSEQIVISGNALSDNDGEDRSNRVRWSFKRLGKVGDE